MSEPFIGEIKMVGYNWAQVHWASCDGQKVDISQNPMLYSVLGLAFGGDGHSTFNLPNLQGRTPLHRYETLGLRQGFNGGHTYQTLRMEQMPSHTHQLIGAKTADNKDPTDRMLASNAVKNPYHEATGASLTALYDGAVTDAGSGQGHYNMMPFLTCQFVIALAGLFPPRS